MDEEDEEEEEEENEPLYVALLNEVNTLKGEIETLKEQNEELNVQNEDKKFMMMTLVEEIEKQKWGLADTHPRAYGQHRVLNDVIKSINTFFELKPPIGLMVIPEPPIDVMTAKTEGET